MLISDAYRALNAELHNREQIYGFKSRPPRVARARHIAERAGCASILDYGCGKGTNGRELGAALYDPAVPEFEARPEPADLVICWDVLEHVEPACLDEVLRDIAFLARRAAYIIVATRPDGSKLLADGRNPHLIVQPWEWWAERLARVWPTLDVTPGKGEVEALWIA